MAANIHSEGSSKMSREGFLSALAAADHDAAYLEVVAHRSTRSLLREWAAHKLCYKCGIFRSRTEAVDLDYPQPFVMRAGYFFVGEFALLFFW